MKLDKNIVVQALDPLTYFNMLGVFLSVLLVISQTKLSIVVAPLFIIGFSRLIIPVLLMPAAVFSNFMIFFNNLGKPKLESLFLVLTTLYINSFFALWCLGIFELATHKSENMAALVSLAALANFSAILSLLMWVRKDKENVFMVGSVELSQIVLAVVSALQIKFSLQFSDMFLLFLAFMILPIIVLNYLHKIKTTD